MLCYVPQRPTPNQVPPKPVLAALTCTNILFAVLDDVVKTLPRRRLLEAECFQGDKLEPAGLPRTLLYAPSFDSIIMGTAITEHEFPLTFKGPWPPYIGKRVLRAGLCVAPAHGSEQDRDSDQESYLEPIPVFHLFARQRVLSMTIWSHRSWDYVVIGTAAYRKNPPPQGRIYIFRLRRVHAPDGVKQIDEEDMELELVKEDKLPGPVRAVATFNSAQPLPSHPPKLVVCVDKKLQVYEFLPGEYVIFPTVSSGGQGRLPTMRAFLPSSQSAACLDLPLLSIYTNSWPEEDSVA
jgi:CPSF A subunit region